MSSVSEEVSVILNIFTLLIQKVLGLTWLAAIVYYKST